MGIIQVGNNDPCQGKSETEGEQRGLISRIIPQKALSIAGVLCPRYEFCLQRILRIATSCSRFLLALENVLKKKRSVTLSTLFRA